MESVAATSEVSWITIPSASGALYSAQLDLCSVFTLATNSATLDYIRAPEHHGSMNKRCLIVLVLIAMLAFNVGLASTKNTIDPTGTYELVEVNNKTGKDLHILGDIRVKKVAPNRIKMAFEITMPAPAYNQGRFKKNLKYRSNRAVFTDEHDKSCRVTFVFSEKTVVVDEETADFNNGCGFGHAVVAKGTFKKTSNKPPVFPNY